ncbi:MAG: hypothetical protein ACI8ZM_002038 [Crocinitomix sp.]|jgi:hypothetical protein
MKRLFSLLTILFICLTTFGQLPKTIEFGYLGHFSYQPGMKLGLQFDLKSWEKELKKKSDTRSTVFFVRPSIGTFSRINYNLNLSTGIDGGLELNKASKSFFHKYSLGLNYLMHSELNSITVNLEGKVINKDRENRHYILPLITYGFGKNYSNGLGWYTNLSGGLKISTNYENIGMLFTEIGMSYQLKNK